MAILCLSRYSMLGVCWGKGGQLPTSLLSQTHRVGEFTLEMLYLSNYIGVALFIPTPDLDVGIMDSELML